MSGLLFTRRNFLNFVGGGVASAKVLNNAAQAQLMTTGVILGKPSRGMAAYDGFASTKGIISNVLSASTTSNARSGHYARDDITQLKIFCTNYYLSEVAPGATMSINASVEYPAGTLTQILFSASATGTIPDGGTLISDLCTPTFSIPCGERFWIRCFLSNASGIPILPGGSGGFIDTATDFMGDALDGSMTDKTMMGEIEPVHNEAYYPGVISSTTAPTVVFFGDSIFEGTSDTLDFTGDVGGIARAVGPSFGYWNGARNAELLSDFVAAHTQRLLALPFCTYVFMGYGTNDIFASHSAMTIEADFATAYGLIAPTTVNQVTICPRTTSTDAWVTTVNQTVLATESVRLAVNTSILGAGAPPGGSSDFAAPVTATGGKWVAFDTTDGVHPDQMGALAIVSGMVIDTTLIGTPVPVISTGSAWGDTGTTLSLSTFHRANDLVSHVTGAGNSFSTARGAGSNSTGKHKVEYELMSGIDVAGGALTFLVGLIDGTATAGAGLDSFIGNIADSFGAFNAGGAIFTNAGGPFSAPVDVGGAFDTNCGDVFGLEVDFTNGFAYLSRNGVYFLSGAPTSGAMGTGHVASWTPGGLTLFPGFSLFRDAERYVRVRTVQFLYPVSTGYSTWG